MVREKQQLEDMGLEEGVHFTVKMPEGGGGGLCLNPQGGCTPLGPYMALRGDGS